MNCSGTPWTSLHPSASCLTRGSLGEPFKECTSPRTVLAFFSPPLAPTKHHSQGLPHAHPGLVLPEGHP